MQLPITSVTLMAILGSMSGNIRRRLLELRKHMKL